MGHLGGSQLVAEHQRELTSELAGAGDADFYSNGQTTTTVTVNNTQTVGNITFDGSGYTLSGGSLNLTAGTITANQNATIGSVIGGATNLTKAGAGALILTGVNTYSGSTTISAGTLQVGSGASGGPGSINGTSGVLDNGFLAFDSSTSVTSFAHNISGSGGVGQMSSGKALRLEGTNTYAGPTLISAGTLQSGSASYGYLPSTTSVEIASGGVYWVVGTQTVASLSDLGGSSGKVLCSSASTATLTLAPSAGTTTFSGIVQNYSGSSGTLALVLAGTGTQVHRRQQHLQRRHHDPERRALREQR